MSSKARSKVTNKKRGTDHRILARAKREEQPVTEGILRAAERTGLTRAEPFAYHIQLPGGPEYLMLTRKALTQICLALEFAELEATRSATTLQTKLRAVRADIATALAVGGAS